MNRNMPFRSQSHIREYRSQEFWNCTRYLTWSIDSGSSEHFHSWYSVTPFSLCCLFAGHYSYPKPNILNSPIAINILSFILFWFIVPYLRVFFRKSFARHVPGTVPGAPFPCIPAKRSSWSEFYMCKGQKPPAKTPPEAVLFIQKGFPIYHFPCTFQDRM